MLENRSFDHMLGFLKYDDPGIKINGLTGDETNYGPEELPDVKVSGSAGDVHDLNPDPAHDFDDITSQIFSDSDTTKAPDMKGFVRDYYKACKDATRAGNVMKCFTPATLPVLSTLAKAYGVCDRWFSSVPGSTIPNRLFVHGASSNGSVNQDAIDAPFGLHTIFESMGDNTVHDYRIYTSGASILLANKYLMGHQAKFASYDKDFEDDAVNGNLPAYTFVEPCYDDDGKGKFASSQHPDFPVDRGEALIADVYNILRQSPGWNNTLLLIIYDEHGGIFDHVAPPVVQMLPENAHLPLTPTKAGFDFTRLGVRVPAVFVSPCIRPNTVINDRDFEHSSVVATVRNLFCPGTPQLSWREAQANTFEDVLVLTGTDIRTDTVHLPKPVVSVGIDLHAGAETRAASDLSVLMAEAMHYSLTQVGDAAFKPSSLTTAAQVSNYLQATHDLVTSGTAS